MRMYVGNIDRRVPFVAANPTSDSHTKGLPHLVDLVGQTEYCIAISPFFGWLLFSGSAGVPEIVFLT